MSKTKFGYIAAIDSSAGTLKLFNPTGDTEKISLSISPQGDFTILVGIDSPLLLLPFDSISAIPIVMHASINRKAIRDTLLLRLHWYELGQEVANTSFHFVLSGGCSDPRFRFDSTLKHIYASVVQDVVGNATIFNLSKDSIYLLTEVAATGNAGSDYFYTYGSHFELLPLDSFSNVIHFLPLQPGVWEAQLVFIDNYDSGHSNVAGVVFDGVATVDDVLPLPAENSLSIYPNPSSSEFRIQGMNSGSFFEIYDILGNQIFKSKIDQDVWDGRDDSGLPCHTGQYFVVITDDNRRNIFPIILNR